MLRLRIITAIVLIAAVFGAIFYLPTWAFDSATVLLMTMGVWELSLMFWPQQLLQRLLFSGVILTIAVISLLFLSPPFLLLYGLLWWLIAPLILVHYAKHHSDNGSPNHMPFGFITRYAMGIGIFVPFVAALNLLQTNFGSGYILYVLAIVWANDIGAYFSGSLYGSNLLAPTISPKKTLEGLYGGIVLGSVITICGGFLLKIHGIRWPLWIAFGIIVSLWSVIGDLFESMLKRQARIKDSGTLLPGHGGIYDRVDSLTAALPLFAIGMWLINF